MSTAQPAHSRSVSLAVWLLSLVVLGACSGGSETTPASPSLAVAVAERDTVDQFLTARNVAAARERVDALLATLRSRSDTNSLAMAVAQDANVATLLRDPTTRSTDTTLELADKVVGLKIEHDAGALERARSLKNLGEAHYLRQDLDRALAHYTEAYDLRSDALGAPDLQSARIAHNAALCERRPAAALQWFRRALAARDSLLSADDPAVGRSSAYLGEYLTRMKRFEEARPYLQRACDIFADPATYWGIKSRHYLGIFLLQIGDLAEAQVLYDEILQDWDPAAPKANLLLPRAAQASVFRNLGETAEAIAIYEELLAIVGTEPAYEDLAAEWLTRVGEIQTLGGRPDEAVASLHRARVIRNRLYPDGNAYLATTLHDLGFSHSRAGHVDSAIVYYEQALAMRRAIPAEAQADTARSLLSLASLQLRAGRPELADSLAQRAGSALSRQADAPSLAMLGNALQTRALALAVLDRPDSAMILLARVERIRRENLRLYYGVFHENLARQQAQRLTSGLSLAVALAERQPLSADLVIAAANLTILGRQIDLDVLASRERRSRLAVEPLVRAAADTLAARRERLADLVVRGHDPADLHAYARALKETRQAVEQAEFRLARISGSFRDEREAASAGHDAVRAALPAGVVLISYVAFTEFDGFLDDDRYRSAVPMARWPRRDTVYGAFVFHGNEVKFVRLGRGDDLETAVTAWRREVLAANDRTDLSSAGLAAGQHLRRLAWDPLGARLAGATEIWIVPTAALHLVYFAALPGLEHEYLGEETPPMLRISSERDLVGDAPPRGRGALLVGGPDFDSLAPFALAGAKQSQPGGSTEVAHRGVAVQSVDLQSLDFRPLPGARAEIDTVSRLWRHRFPGEPVAILSGAAATEAAFEDQASGMRHLHLATHGYLLGLEPTERRTRPDQEEAPSPLSDLLGAHPLLRSGLALAGANHRVLAGEGEEDGILTAAEVVGLDLSSVAEVVLSACETGLGEITDGESVFGLQRAFHLAGAGSLVMSLWPVPDAMTARWMTVYYSERLECGRSPVVAARTADLTLLAERRATGQPTPPLAWGGFVVVGREQ